MIRNTLKTGLIFAMMALMAVALSFCKKEDSNSGLTDEDKTTIANYVADKNLNGHYTDSGLYYVVHLAGSSNHPTLNSYVTVSYKGYYTDGTALDEGDNFSAFLYQLIQGWKEGLPYIGEGGKITLIIPSYMAYNNGVLVFDITLHNFSK